MATEPRKVVYLPVLTTNQSDTNNNPHPNPNLNNVVYTFS